MARCYTFLATAVILLGCQAIAQAQASSVAGSGNYAEVTSAAYGLEAESLAAEVAEDIASAAVPGLGPTPVSSVGILMDLVEPCTQLSEYGIRTFGWVEGGYTDASVGQGLLSVQPRQNRFGDEFLFNQLGLVIQKPLSQDEFNLGFNVRYFAGADAALGQPKGGIDDPPGSDRFSQDFRDLNVSAHLPVFTETRHGRESRADEHDHRIQRFLGALPAVLFQRLSVLLFPGWSVHRFPDQSSRDRAIGSVERDDAGCQYVFHQTQQRLVLLHRPGELLDDDGEADPAHGLGLLRTGLHFRSTRVEWRFRDDRGASHPSQLE